MRTRQSNKSLKLNKNKPKLQTSNSLMSKQDSSYECIIQNSEYIQMVPKLIIKKKKKPSLSKQNSIKNFLCENKINHFNKEQTKNDTEMDSSLSKSSNIDYIEEESKSFLPEDIVKMHILKCSNYSKIINCKDIYENLCKVTDDRSKCWNELYSPDSIIRFLSRNSEEVSKLKKWLKSWKIKKCVKKQKKCRYSKDSDFESDSFEDNIVYKSLPPVCIIEGSCGSGKSSLVYIAATELNYKVFEMNCSSKRASVNFEKMRNAAENKFVTLNGVGSHSNIEQASNTRKRKMPITSEAVSKKFKSMQYDSTNTLSPKLELGNCSLFLFDDADVVMEEDKGFWASVCDLARKETRPIILTGTDSIEIQKLVHKLRKKSHITVKLDKNLFSDVAVYLQLILLSRGHVVEHEDMLQWILGFSGPIPDIRSCLNNLQFSFVNNQLNFQHKLQFYHWSHSMDFQMLLEQDRDSSIKVSNIKSVSEEKKENQNIVNKRDLRSIALQLDKVCSIDSLSNFKSRTKNTNLKVIERNTTFNRLGKSYHNSSVETLSEISDTLKSLYNSCLPISPTITSTDYGNFAKKYFLSQLKHNQKWIDDVESPADIEKRLTKSIYLKSAVSDVRDRLDRFYTLKTIARYENKRKINFPRRKRARMNFTESDLSYLSKQFEDL